MRSACVYMHYTITLPVFPMPFEGVWVGARAPEQAEEAKDDEGQEKGVDREGAYGKEKDGGGDVGFGERW